MSQHTVWCWVRDLATGHRYDVALQTLDRLLAAGAVAEIPGRRIRAINPRPSKRFVDLAGRRSVPTRR